MPVPGSIGVILVGLHGYGRRHLDEVLRLTTTPAYRDTLHLAGLADPVPAGALPEPIRTAIAGIPFSDRLEPLLESLPGPVLTIVATPLHTHGQLALTALEHGSAVLLEKPPATSVAEFRRLQDAVERRGGVVQVGFQDVGSPAPAVIRDLIAAGAIGRLTGVGAAGVWSRDDTYYARSRWAGRRRLEGQDVVDGVLTNPFAHAVAAALSVDGSARIEDVREVEVELHRANPIEADDTSCVRIRTTAGTTIVVAATLCADTTEEPVVTAHGTEGRLEWRYKRGELHLRTRNGSRSRPAPEPGERSFDPPRLLANLVDHLLDRQVPLLVPLASTGAFTAVLDAIRRAPDPVPIPAPAVIEHVSGGDGVAERVVRRSVPGVESAVHRAAEELRLFSELAPRWSGAPLPGAVAPA